MIKIREGIIVAETGMVALGWGKGTCPRGLSRGDWMGWTKPGRGVL